MRIIKKTILNKLIDSFPELEKDVKEIVYDFSEIYLHLIFGDVFNPYLIHLLEDPAINYRQLLKAGELIEYMLMLDEDIQEVAVATVLERLSDDVTKLLIFGEFAGENTKKYINCLL